MSRAGRKGAVGDRRRLNSVSSRQQTVAPRWEQVGLTAEEYRRIVELLGREPNDLELGLYGVMWSEHCSYKSSRLHLKRLPTEGERVLVGPGENAGVLDIGDGLAIAVRAESHNHPSAIEPYQGAATGVGGILRDIFTMGARPIALLDSLRFGRLEPGEAPAGAEMGGAGEARAARNRYLVGGVVKGIADYGNCLDPGEWITVRRDGQVMLTEIGPFIDEYCHGVDGEADVHLFQPVEALSFDPVSGEARWARIKRLVRRVAREMLCFKTSMGRTLTVTPDHPMIVVREGIPEVRPAGDVQPGDRLPLILHWPTRVAADAAEEIELDLIELLGDVRSDLLVKLPQEVAWHHAPAYELRAVVGSTYSRQARGCRGCLPLSVFRRVEPALGVPRRDLLLYPRGGRRTPVPAVLRLDTDLARLIGYYLAEGLLAQHGTTYRVVWTFGKHQERWAADVCDILERMGIRYALSRRRPTTAIVVDSWLLGTLLDSVWRCGRSAPEKSIPDLFFDAPRDLQVELLKGLVRGSGWVAFPKRGSRIRINFATACRRLSEQVTMLLQCLGVVPCRYTRQRGSAAVAGRRVMAGRVYHLGINGWDAALCRDWFDPETNARIDRTLAEYKGGGFRPPLYQADGRLATVAVTSISTRIGAGYVYDLEVPETGLFVTSGGMVTHNCVGVPTVGGEIYFEECYNENPLVNVMCVGLIPKEKIVRGRAEGVGNPVFLVGAKTGRDGIHGASLLASQEFNEAAEEMRPAVQVGDPFMEKLLIEACLELMETDAVAGVNDLGAAGLTSSCAETASRAGNGVEIDVALVPRREEGMTPYEVMLSESQERMLVIAKRGREVEVEAIFQKWGLEAARIGRVTDDGRLRILDGGRVIADVPARTLTEEAPAYDRPQRRPDELDRLWAYDFGQVPDTATPAANGAALRSVLGSPTVASKSWVYNQYDHMVRTSTVAVPGAADAAVLRIRGTRKGIALATDGSGRFCRLDPFTGAAMAVAEAARNVACVGARPIGLTNCLNFASPERPEVMWSFSRVIDGMAEACRVLGIPVTGGNVSFYNETLGRGIHPTPVIGMVGLLENLEKRCSPGFRRAGDLIALLGPLDAAAATLAGSEYLKVVRGTVAGRPTIDLGLEARLQQLLLEAIDRRLLASAHDLSEGGLAVAVAECCFAGMREAKGAVLDIRVSDGRQDALLFGEAPSRVVVSLPGHHLDALAGLAEEHGVPFALIGTVGGDRLVVTAGGRMLLDEPVAELERIWREALPCLMGGSR